MVRAVNAYLGELYTFQQAVDFISNSYFDGHQILFPDYLRDLTEIISDTSIIEGFRKKCQYYREYIT